MKAVISDRIYLEVLPHQQQNIDKELTYAIPSFKYGDPPLIIKNMAMIRYLEMKMFLILGFHQPYGLFQLLIGLMM